MAIDPKIRDSYPLLAMEPDAACSIYLDSAATALKPQCVVDAVVDVLQNKTANVHRSVHRLGDLATEAYENSRQVVADFIAADSHEIVFLRNTTEALNLVANGCKGDGTCLVSIGDHHSNILPWQGDVRRMTPAKDGRFDLEKLQAELARGDVRLVSISHVSNVLGIANDIRAVADMCHEQNAILAVDAAQSAPHEPIDVYDLDCDFLAFSGHKLGAPTGVGVLYGKAEHLDRIDWHLRGGATVEEVHADEVVPKDSPWRFEAGTPAIESVVGLAAAIEFLESIGMENIQQHQVDLADYAMEQIRQRLPRVQILGPLDETRCGPVSFVQREVSPHLIARGLSDGYGICARSGFHCAQPLHEFLGVPASLRLSFYVYNTTSEIERTIDAIEKLFSVNS